MAISFNTIKKNKTLAKFFEEEAVEEPKDNT